MHVTATRSSTKASSGNSYGADPTALRLLLLRNGYRPVPIVRTDGEDQSAGKRPLMDGGRISAPRRRGGGDPVDPDYRTSTNTGLLAVPPSAGTSTCATRNWRRQLIDVARTMLGATPLERVGMAPKTLLCYRTETPFPKISTDEFTLPGDDPTVPGYKWHRVEILAEGQQFVAYGIHPDTLAPMNGSRVVRTPCPWATCPSSPRRLPRLRGGR